jgi:putative DNA primase/helicase
LTSTAASSAASSTACFATRDDGDFLSLRVFDDGAKAGEPPLKIRGCKLNGEREALLQEVASVASFAATHPRSACFAPPVVLLNNPKTARAKDVAAGVALSVELDQRPNEARRFLESLLGRATFVIASGGTWTDPATGELQDRLHLHWRLSEPTTTPEEHDRLRLARQLARDLVGGDGSAVPLVHPLRWPGSWHRKLEPRLTTIVAEHDAELELEEALELLQDATGATAASPSARGPREPQCEPEVLHRLAEIIPNDDLEWNRWNTIGMAFWAASGGSEDGLDAFRTWSAKSSKHGSKSEDGATARWARITQSPPTRISLTYLVGLAQAVDPTFRDPRAPDVTGDARYDFSHDGLALDMGRHWHSYARHVALWGKWMFWADGTLWRTDETLSHMTRTRDFLRGKADRLVRDAQSGKLDDWGGGDREKAIALAEALAKTLRTKPMIASVADLARSNAELVATVAQWDADLMATPMPQGSTVDLRTGLARLSRREDYATKITGVCAAPLGTPAPLWAAFLARITNGDAELQSYLKRMSGYFTTGLVSEHALFFFHGTGANGKSVFINTLMGIMGDFAITIGTEMLMVSTSERHPTEVARLRGVRMAVGSEIERGKTWAEAKIKSLTGGDRLQGRFMRQDFFEFDPQFKLVLVGNHKPSLRGVDEAIRRRLHLVPFTVTIPPKERDPDLAEKLKAEWPAILAWMIEGCLEWQQTGLAPPKAVLNATGNYLAAEDSFELWRDDCTEPDNHTWESSADLWTYWKTWAERAGEPAGTQKSFGMTLEERGLRRERHPTTRARGFRGIRIKRPDYTDDPRYGA